MKNIKEIAKKINVSEEYLIPYGHDKAKIDLKIVDTLKDNKDGKLVLVTAITPTKAGEGKTTTSIALHDGFHKINVDSLLCLREPSLGPVFGIKGGATGGGLASVIPSEDINLHFTGDMHALTSSINLIAAIIDNHIYQGNELRINKDKILWKRALDMNDRALRSVYVANDDKKCEPRHDEFVITVASELMAIFCLAKDEEDFRKRVNNIIVAYDLDDKPVYLEKLKISNAILKLMRNALNPNLVQTLEENPCIIHGGPFANIAHGCNSIIATRLALKLSPIVITEAGFGSDLGMEKFMDIACRVGEMKPDAVVMVATIRALKLHGGALFEDLKNENLEALRDGLNNLKQHMENVAKYGVPSVVCINKFDTDTEAEVKLLKEFAIKEGFKVALCDAFTRGGEGAVELAKLVKHVLETEESHYAPIYDVNKSNKEKIETICKEIYRADDVVYSEEALKQLEEFEKIGYTNTPICIAKTPQSFSDDPKLLNTPRNFKITIREIRLSAGANFIVPLTGAVMTMPGLPKVPAAVKMEENK